jgi:hypothetical protein
MRTNSPGAAQVQRAASAAVAMALVLGTLQLVSVNRVSADDFCQPGQAPGFVLGFAALQEQLGDTMGTALECEHANPENGDSQIKTSTGLAFYRKQTNTPTFTDGYNHWAVTDAGLVTWIGSSIDPPGTCLEPYDSPERACLLGPSADLFGYLRASGTRHAYTFEVVEAGTAFNAMLLNLPADYDLYLVDSATQLLAGSVLDGAQPEQLNLSLPETGTYYLYVVSDPGRAADPNNPYEFLFASVSPSEAAVAGVQVTAEGEVVPLAPGEVPTSPPPAPPGSVTIPPDKTEFDPPKPAPPAPPPTDTPTLTPTPRRFEETPVCVTPTPTPVVTPTVQPVNPGELLVCTPTPTPTIPPPPLVGGPGPSGPPPSGPPPSGSGPPGGGPPSGPGGPGGPSGPGPTNTPTPTPTSTPPPSMNWSTISSGGGTSTGGPFQLNGTIGQPAAGSMSGGPFTLNGGFGAGSESPP